MYIHTHRYTIVDYDTLHYSIVHYSIVYIVISYPSRRGRRHAPARPLQALVVI